MLIGELIHRGCGGGRPEGLALQTLGLVGCLPDESHPVAIRLEKVGVNAPQCCFNVGEHQRRFQTRRVDPGDGWATGPQPNPSELRSLVTAAFGDQKQPSNG